jgi:CheY-like chemotaxis protein
MKVSLGERSLPSTCFCTGTNRRQLELRQKHPNETRARSDDKGEPEHSDKKRYGVKKSRPIVLVCEDEPLVRLVIVDYLIDNGCTVIEAGSGEDAVGLINGPDQQLDVLFTDIRLGGVLNGWDVAEIFRDRFPKVRVLYTSGYPIEPRRDVTGSEFFTKPYLINDILEACRR